MDEGWNVLAGEFRRWMPGEPPTDGCWLWAGPKNFHGYGDIRKMINRVVYRDFAHRVSFRLFNGPIDDGLLVRHSCDTPTCVQPGHLLTGTHADNLADMTERGRHARGDVLSLLRQGTKHWNVRLTEPEVLAIRALSAEGTSSADLARRFNCTHENIRRIVTRRTWRHLPR